MTNNNLSCKSKLQLNSSSQSINLKDNNMTAGWDALLSAFNMNNSNVEGIVKLSSVLNGVIHDDYYTNNDFSSAEIKTGTTNVDIDLPTDVSGEAIKDSYTVGYKFRVNFPSVYGYDGWLYGVVRVVSSSYIAVKGNYLALTGANPTGVKIQIYNLETGTTYNGVYTITSVVYDSGTGYTQFYVSETISNFLNSITPDYACGIIFEYTDTIAYTQTKPTLDIEVSANCNNAKLTVLDNTDYTLIVDGQIITTPTITRNWTIKSPTTKYADITETDISTFTIGNGTSYNTGANIYTGNYNVLCEVTALYQSTYFDIEYEILGNEAYEVKCDFCLCNLFDCIANIKTKWEAARTTNFSEAERLQRQLTSILASWQLYNMAERCGEDTQIFCNYIKAIADFENCTCDTNQTKEAKEVIPISSLAALNISISPITTSLLNDGYPASPATNQLHLFTDTYNLYKYSGSAWVLQCNLKGATGATGATGVNGADGVNGSTILWNEMLLAESTASSGYQNLSQKYTIDAGTLSNGDSLVLEAIYEIDCNFFTQTYFDIGGTKMCYQYFTPNANKRTVKVVTTLNRISATSTYIVKKLIIMPDIIKVSDLTSSSINWAVNNDFYASVYKRGVGTAGDMVLKSFKAILYKQ